VKIFTEKILGTKELINGMLMDFTYITPIVKEICNELHQKTLLPRYSEQLIIENNEKENALEVFSKYTIFDWLKISEIILKRDEKKLMYRFPKNDCEVLDVNNISAEELAKHLLGKIEDKITMEKLKIHSWKYFF